MVEHVLPLLARLIGTNKGATAPAAAVSVPRTGLRVAAQYGCHAAPRQRGPFRQPNGADDLRDADPRDRGDASRLAPAARLSAAIRCTRGNPPLAEHMTRAKIADALASGAEVLCTACPHCHLRFDAVQSGAPDPSLRTLLYTQLLGQAMGLPAKSLGL